MKNWTPLLFLPFLGHAYGSDSGGIPTISTTSQTPGSCSASGGALFTFSTDISSIHASFPSLTLTPNPSYHGNPARGSVAVCEVAFGYKESSFGSSGYQQFRFAIRDVVVTAKELRLQKGDNWNALGVSVGLNVDVSDETSPVHYPVHKDRFSSSLVNIKTNPKIAVDEAYHGNYSYKSVIEKPVFTTCMRGRDYAAMTFDVRLDIETDIGGSSAPGWDIDFGLIYEECEWQPADDNDWGQVKIKDWESCTYKQASSTNGTKNGFPVPPPLAKKRKMGY